MPRTTPKPDTTTHRSTDTSEEDQLTPLFHVVLLNDEDHTYDYVVEMLATIFCVSAEAAFQHAVEVDTTGRTIVMTCEREQAEFGRDQIHGYGADPRMPRSKGSMTAVVEPAGRAR
jgi:ATP-dependent Clp protease adaptor protein ClpS